jgi:hypothetical protein
MDHSEGYIILAISQIDEAVGEKAKKDRVSGPKLKKILEFLSSSLE